MYELFVGNYERVIGATVFSRKGNKYTPCTVTNYYFKLKKYALVPIDDLKKPPAERRVLYTTRVYVKVGKEET